MVVEILIPISGSYLDGLVTSLIADRYGPERELNPIHKKIMKKFGSWKSLPIRLAITTAVIVGLYYGATQSDDPTTKFSAPEFLSYVGGAMLYGAAAWNSIYYISKRRSE